MNAAQSTRSFSWLYFFILLTSVLTFYLASDAYLWILKQGFIDKVGHFISFFLLSAIIDKAIKLDLGLTIISVMIYSALTELCQWHLGFRNAEVSDVVANCLGCSCYYVFSRLFSFSKGDK